MPKTRSSTRSNGKNKSREQANTYEEAAQSLTEKILGDVKVAYQKEGGLEDVAASLGLTKLRPRNKVTVMIIGNHSAGKSSFVNWYVDENVRNTGVAIESKGFSMVTYGKRSSAPIKGEGSLKYFPHIRGISQFPGLIENFTTITSVSNSRNFPMVDFMDTPGLVGGGVSYSFDVNEAMVYLADHVDLIFVFLDPIGQALSPRTMEVVEKLNVRHSEKMRYYLTKIDTCEKISDVIKLSAQVTQRLAIRVKNTHGWEVPTIFLPNNDTSSELSKLNDIGKLCDGIDQEIKQKVQSNLKIMQSDSEELYMKLRTKLSDDAIARGAAGKLSMRSFLFALLAWVIVPLIALIMATPSVVPFLPADLRSNLILLQLQKPAVVLYGLFPTISVYQSGAFIAGAFFILQILKMFYGWQASRYSLMPYKDVVELKKHMRTCKNILRERETLHSQFISASVHED
eukprot:GSMAST32.ASY1.ANO1.767.1 assembled CDS